MTKKLLKSPAIFAEQQESGDTIYRDEQNNILSPQHVFNTLQSIQGSYLTVKDVKVLLIEMQKEKELAK